jgi:SDR family mycofactocin-dependent oxidoreductase
MTPGASDEPGVAVVTGAARGIGAATVRALAADGWRVLAVDRGGDDPRLPYALGTEAELRSVAACAPDSVTAVLADAADESALADAIAAAEHRHGGVDAVIAAAGVIAGGVPLWEMPAAELDAVIAGNLGATLATARAGIPALLRRPTPRRGRFVAVASTAASRGLPMLAAYCAAKAGIAGLVRALALELRGSGVTANAVSPGSTDTAILQESARLYELASAQEFATQQPIERLLAPEEVAALIVWLVGPAGAGVTGADLPIDGGLSL